MQIINCEQNSEEWYKARCGIPTASGFSNILTSVGKPSKSKDKYLYQLAGERIIGVAEEAYQSSHMERGKEVEEEARDYYEMVKDSPINQVGFCLADRCGCSPDGLVGEDGMVEIKCPKIATHISYLLEGKLPTAYFQQVQGQLYVTGRKWVDFLSYYPALKPFIIRVERDQNFLDSLAMELQIFCEDLETLIEKIK